MSVKYYKNIIFSYTPLTTNFVYRDIFQIYPLVSENAPKSIHINFFPLIIEFAVDITEPVDVGNDFNDLKEFIQENTRVSNQLNKILKLLTTFTNHKFFSYVETELKYGVVIPNEYKDSDLNNKSSECVICAYTYPEMSKELKIDSFTNGIKTTTECLNHYEYYTNDPFDDKKKKIKFPCTIYKTLDNYFSLDTKKQDNFDSILHLFNNGLEIMNRMKSLSFLSFVSCIESLVSIEFKQFNDQIVYSCTKCKSIKESPFICEDCKEPIWAISYKFKKFLEVYVSNNEDNKKSYRDIYNIRSKIVHNGMLLIGDSKFNWSDSPKVDKQYTLREETLLFARISIVNYLLMGPNRTNIK